MDIKNSSSKIIGDIKFSDNKIYINNYSKPLLVIEDEELVKKIKNKDESVFELLFNEYFLSMAELASLYQVCYATMAKRLKAIGINTKSRAGRRNSSYGQVFSEERKKHIGEKSRGRKIPPYERTPEIREKISNSLKEYYKTHEVSIETRQKLSDAWKNGSYDNVPMGRGYNGYFYSIKNEKDFYFRSLLELKYLLLLEDDNTVDFYSVEPFQIKLPNNHHYTPDILINNEILIELKPINHLNWEDKERWEMELKGADTFCKLHNYKFKVVYDTDIDFESRSFKRWFLNNESKLKQYDIRFIKELVWS